jgi:segregation and condensation protein A
VDPVAKARLYGEPMFALPQDLYIPPEALEVFLEPSKVRSTCCCT